MLSTDVSLSIYLERVNNTLTLLSSLNLCLRYAKALTILDMQRHLMMNMSYYPCSLQTSVSPNREFTRTNDLLQRYFPWF